MSKRLVFIFMMIMLLLSACGTESSLEKEKVTSAQSVLLSDDVQVAWKVDNIQASGSGSNKLIHLEIKKKDGPINEFEVNHEKLLHLMVISKDLSFFKHIHPDYKGGGVFEIVNDFPAGGEYRLIADFKPSRGSAMTKMTWVNIEGDSVKPAPLVPDSSMDKTFDGKRVKLSIDQLAVNQQLTLTFTFTDAKTGEPITDLQPYLGAIGHVTVLSQDGEQYLHVHGEEDQGSGPDAQFETSFPKSGIYKIWGQFQKDQNVFTASYVVNVP